MQRYMPLVAAAAGLVVMPFLLLSIGLTMTSAAEVVIFAIACMALNVLTGHTGLVSFGHGAWFGFAAYAAGIAQRSLFPESFWGPALIGVGATAVVATVFGFLILRRRGVYFSLLTLALSAMLYVIAFRWTEVTGGENGLGGITRPAFAGMDFEAPGNYYLLVAGIGFAIVYLLWRLYHSPLGSVLVAIRENEQRARFLGYRTNRYKLAAFVTSASITGLAGILLLYKNRMTSAEPISVIFSGELLAMVVIGGMRSFVGPMIGALFYVLFREFLSIYTPNWLFWFGLLFVGFVVFSPDGLTGVWQRVWRMIRPAPEVEAAMAGRKIEERPLPVHLRPGTPVEGPALEAHGISKAFGALQAVDGVTLKVADRSLHALIGPNGAGKTTAFNLMSGMIAPDTGHVSVMGRPVASGSPEAAAELGIGRSFQITNLFPDLSVEENIRLAVQARSPGSFNSWRPTGDYPATLAEARELIDWLGLAGMEKAQAGSLYYGGQRLLDLGLALAAKPRILLLDEPLAGLAAAERVRVGDLIKTISREMPVLLVEHDIDRVFQLADAVTVMNEGRVLLDGDAQSASTSPVVQEVYIGAGNAAIAARPRESAASADVLLKVEGLNTHYGKSHILGDVSFELHNHEIMALLGRNGAGKSTMLKSLIGIAPVSSGSITLGETDIASWPASEKARAGIGYVPQGRGLFAGMSVRHNLELGRLKRRTGAGSHWDEEKIFEFFPRIRERLETPADMLSGGEQQMVAVARALSGDTKLLLLDEPFEGLAPAVVEQLFESFDRLRKEVSIIIVDHNLDLALALSDRTVALERGRVIHQGPSAALRDDFDLRRKVLWL
ncbi:ATP-binding cassette domain-containing protein [Stappia sp.]|uniref:branched-chain amino acid ABC transporter ATP-binding protein/permease n=1 Tax=Stappia sp. TaxID=1870903 RepID=UPI003D1014FB